MTRAAIVFTNGTITCDEVVTACDHVAANFFGFGYGRAVAKGENCGEDSNKQEAFETRHFDSG